MPLGLPFASMLSAIVEISSEVVEISSELVRISSELFLTISELLIISAFIVSLSVLFRRPISLFRQTFPFYVCRTTEIIVKGLGRGVLGAMRPSKQVQCLLVSHEDANEPVKFC